MCVFMICVMMVMVRIGRFRSGEYWCSRWLSGFGIRFDIGCDRR